MSKIHKTLKPYENYYFISILLFSFLFSCDDDFDINGEWENIPVVYGLLNPDDTAHYIRLNKAFLGEGDVYEMAQTHDSIYYSDAVSVSFIEYEIANGSEGNPYAEYSWQRTASDTIRLHITTEIEKDKVSTSGGTGVFNASDHVLYKTTQELKKEYKYKLEIKIPGLDALITSETYMIGEVDIKSVLLTNPVFQFNMTREGNNNREKVEWYTPVYSKITQTVIEFNYFEVNTDDFTDTSYHQARLEYPEQTTENIRNSLDAPTGFITEFIFGGSDFYQRLGAEIPVKESNIKRVMTGMDFLFLAGGNEFYNYLRVSQTQGGFGQDPAGYSNIKNGIGMFDCRYSYRVNDKLMTNPSMDSLARGRFTKQLKFSNIAEPF